MWVCHIRSISYVGTIMDGFFGVPLVSVSLSFCCRFCDSRMILRKRMNLWYLPIPTFKNSSSEKCGVEIFQRKLACRPVDPSKSKPSKSNDEGETETGDSLVSSLEFRPLLSRKNGSSGYSFSHRVWVSLDSVSVAHWTSPVSDWKEKGASASGICRSLLVLFVIPNSFRQ